MLAALYILCTATSLACAVLLLRGYLRSRTRLLFWSGICFVGLTANNLLLFIDLVMFPMVVDLSIWRSVAALVGLTVLVYGLIWETP